MNDRRFWVGTGYCIMAALAWAIIGPVSRVCFAEGMGPTSVAFWRLAISGLCFLVHALLSGGLHARGRDLVSMLLFGAVNVSLVILSLQISIQKSGGALAIILMFTAPAWVAFFSRPSRSSITGETTTKRVLFSWLVLIPLASTVRP